MKYCTFPSWDAGTACITCGFVLPTACRSQPIMRCGTVKQTPEQVAKIIAGKSGDLPPRRSPEERLEGWGKERLAICRACDHYRNDDGERCGVLVAKGRPGLLMHPKGVPNPSARCELGEWGPEPPPREGQ